jgi:hypothetical protein
MVSLRLTTTSMVEKPRLAWVLGGDWLAGAAAVSVEDRATSGVISRSRGNATSVATIAASPTWSRYADRVGSPGMADLMKFGTIYTT